MVISFEIISLNYEFNLNSDCFFYWYVDEK